MTMLTVTCLKCD